MLEFLVAVVAALLACIGAMMAMMYRGMTKRTSAIETSMNMLKASFYNHARSNFMLLAKLHPGSAEAIASASLDFFSDPTGLNGKPKASGVGA